MTAPSPAELRSALDPYRLSILEFARDLVAIPSENPPGQRYQECVERIRAELSGLGLPCERIADLNLLSSWGEGRPAVYFHGHYDVVPAQSRAQFRPLVERERLHGRGSADMKAGLAGMLYAMVVLRELEVPLDGRVCLCIVADEETGGARGSRALDEAGRLGQDGVAMLTMEPTGGTIWNANRGAVTLEVTVRGRTAHVGLQHQGVNAFDRMIDAARAFQELKRDVESRRTRYAISPPEAARSILMLGGRVEGGTAFNAVPDLVRFTVERRFNPEEDLAEERARLFSLIDGLASRGIDCRAEVIQEGWSSGLPADHSVARTLADAAAEVTGSRPPFGMCPGLLETRWYGRRGVPAVAYGPGDLSVSHGPEEAVDMERVYDCAVVYALAAARLLGSEAAPT